MDIGNAKTEATRKLDLTGGESVYCINESQMRLARRLADEDPASSARIQALFRQIESDFTRNEQAAIAFLLIEQLNLKPR
ncbi:hypothetical protein [Salinispira pacifica]